MLRIDDTDPSRTVPGGEAAILADLALARGRVGRGAASSERARRRLRRRRRASPRRRVGRRGTPTARSASASVTLLRADGTATYQLASVADDLALGITHVIRGSDHRPNEELQRRIARAIGGELPEVRHIGLLLGDDGKKLSKRHGGSSVADLRAEGIPAAAAPRLPRGARTPGARRPSRPRPARPARDRRDHGDERRGARRRRGRTAGAGARASRRPDARRGAGDGTVDPRSRAGRPPGRGTPDARAVRRAPGGGAATSSTRTRPARSSAS